MPRILRPSAKAVVLRDACLLVTRNLSADDPDGEWLLLPGGGQRPGEDLGAALVREVAEETGHVVEPGRLLWVREYIPEHHEFAHFDEQEHAIEFMFEASVTGAAEASEADVHQVGWEWVPLEGLPGRRFYPQALVAPLVRHAGGGDPGPVYLGDVN
ncbi:MAG: NUDIX domain-containing protein [Actinobacteria bacterium]|nr:NUDIX domain-containing protein [Actinomycetota bacterium]